MSSTKRMQALGRLKPGQMNKTEARYAQHLLERKIAGEILWFQFEILTIKIAPDTRLTIDFAVINRDGVVEMHDVKGSKFMIQDDAKVKMKVAASIVPFTFFYAFPVKGGGWLLEEVG